MRDNDQVPNGKELAACLEIADQNWDGAKRFWSYQRFYAGAWKALPIVALGVPLLLYLFGRVAVTVGFWVLHGFKNPTGV